MKNESSGKITWQINKVLILCVTYFKRKNIFLNSSTTGGKKNNRHFLYT